MTVRLPDYLSAQVPPAPNTIEKDVPLKQVLNEKSVGYLARNIQLVDSRFDVECFCTAATDGFEPLALMARGQHIARALHKAFNRPYQECIDVLLASMTGRDTHAESFGLAGFFYLPHSSFIAEYGLNSCFNDGQDPFSLSMHAQYELTQRFTAEFSIRPFLIEQTQRTIDVLNTWLEDENPHVRRLCSEGTRPKLPWGKRIQVFIEDPAPVLPILEALKDDNSLYVRRSVANHLGDIAKDHPQQVYALCERWLSDASDERKWLIRHALRYPAKKGSDRAIELRLAAK